MKKRILSVLLLLCMVACAVRFNAGAHTPAERISLTLRSDVAGRTEADYTAFITVNSGGVRYSFHNEGPVFTADYAGTVTYAPLTAGRTYYVDYLLEAADGYTLPDTLGLNDLDISCGKGVTVYGASVVSARERISDGGFETFRGLRIQAKVLVDGSPFQRILGWFQDLILKIRAWSLY